jgi:predicted metal-dependent phosphoesterase TrpH
MSWLDLHMHSSESMDGEFTPEELVLIAKESGVKVMALCDHNLTTGVKRAVNAAQKAGIVCIPAVELDVECAGRNFHIIGYGIDPDQEELVAFGERTRKKKAQNGRKRIQKMRELGFYFEEEEVIRRSEQGNIIIAKIFEVVLEDERNQGNPLVEKYRNSVMPGVDFFWDNCAAPGSIGHVAEGNQSAAEGIRCIKAAGGVPILAHPGVNVGESAYYFEKLVEAGIEGVEAFCSYHQKGEDVFYREQAAQYGLFFTQGSDFHGKLKPQIKAGSIESGMEEEIYKNLCKQMERTGKESEI